MATAKKTAAKKAPAAAKKAAAARRQRRAGHAGSDDQALQGRGREAEGPEAAWRAGGLQEREPAGAASAVLDNRRKDLKALVEANEKSYKGLQAVVQRQAEMLKSVIGEWQSAVKDMPGKDPKENLAKLDEMGRAAFKQALADMKELAELAAKSQADAFNVVRDRINDNVEQVSKLLKSGGK